MTPAETYQQFVMNFPAVSAEDHSWANVHDGKALKFDLLLDMLVKRIRSEQAVVIVHMPVGVGAVLPLEAVCDFVAPHVLRAEIQVADPGFTARVAISISGVAAAWNYD